MPTFFIFLFKVNIALLLFCTGYYLVLRHLTFYSLNRVYLITAIVFSTVYPKIDLAVFARQHQAITQPVQRVVLIWQAPALNSSTHPGYWYWAGVVFWVVATILALRLFMQLFSLFKLYRGSKPARLFNYRVRLMDVKTAPFSFWQSIYVNPANHSAADLDAILLHEQAHVKGWHTIDILLAEISSIFYWFNPGIWLIKKAVRENIEFITDRKILNKGFDSKIYQYSLLNVSFNDHTPAIVNHFNISTIKKRIMMMNTERSSRFNLTRYAFVVPAVVVLLLFFTLSKADIARPVTRHISGALKPVTVGLNKAALTVFSGKESSAKSSAATETFRYARVEARAMGLKHMDITTQKDTDKNISLRIHTTAKADTGFNMLINGVSGDVKNIDPNDIESISIVNGDRIKAFLSNDAIKKLQPGKKVILVFTKNNTEGNILKSKMDKALVNSINLTGSSAKLLSSTKFTGRGVNVFAYNADEKPALSGKVNNVVVYNGCDTCTVNLKLNKVTVKPFALNRKYTVKDSTIFGVSASTSVRKFTSYPGAVVGMNSFTYASSNVNRISDKLIIIDGEEATEKEMKKLSAFDIDRMNVRSDADTIKKYGNKARYGVVYIYTKKNK